ncbi:hypothetical protein CUJ87_22495 [Paraburkholderia caledonica]|jgi:hypothetical protein|nr:hypothetical protein CUJ87_22495 [Paraburkholderia caledonica]
MAKRQLRWRRALFEDDSNHSTEGERRSFPLVPDAASLFLAPTEKDVALWGRAAGSCTFHAALRFRIGHAAVCLGRRTRGDTDMLLGLKGALNLTARVSAADSFSKMLSLSTPRSDIPQCPSPVAASGDSRLTSEGAPRSKDPFLPLYAHR